MSLLDHALNSPVDMLALCGGHSPLPLHLESRKEAPFRRSGTHAPLALGLGP